MKIQNLLRGLVLLTATLSVNSSVAQEKLFQAALAQGRQPGAFYVARNDKGKGISPEKMKQYAREHNYLIGDYTTQTVDKFGDKSTAVGTFEFLPQNEYSAYAYEKMKETSAPSFTQLTQKGKGECCVYVMGKFYQLKNVYWTGELEGGMLSGMGYGFVVNGDNRQFVYIRGAFQHGIPKGDCTFTMHNVVNTLPQKVNHERYNLTVGELQGGYAQFNEPGGKYGFVGADGTMAIAPSYESVIKGFQNGKAEVVLENKEIVIDTKGTFLDYTAKQKRLIAAEKAEAERKAQAEKQAALERKIAEEKAAVERQRAAEEAERRRVEKFRHAQPGDKVYYSQDFTHTESFLLFFSHSTGYSMAVVCFVEQNVNNGERLQIRVGSVKSSNSNYYSTPEIDGIEYRKGDVLWIKPLNDRRWQIE